MHITRMKIEGIPPFTDPVEFNFDERVNVFAVPNAVGKSTVLLGIVEVASSRPHTSAFYCDDFARQEIRVSPDWPIGHDQPTGSKEVAEMQQLRR